MTKNTLDFVKFDWIHVPFKEIETIEGGPQRLYKVTEELNLPSMTSILKCLDEEGGLDDWIKRVGQEEADRIVQEAIERGESLHYLSEKYLKNDLTRSEVQGTGKVLFNRVKKHLDRLGPIIAIEVPLYNLDDGYAGRVDCVAFDDEGDLCIVDHKNTRSTFNLGKDYSRKKMFKYMLQCVGYGRALYKMLGTKPTHGILIVGNYRDMTSDRFKFKLAPFEKHFDDLIEIYYGRKNKKESIYFSL